MTSNKQHWSYLAGLIDGEGHINIVNSRRKAEGHHKNPYNVFSLAVGVNGTSLVLMKWLVRYFGGVYYSRDRKPGLDVWKVAYEWRPKGKENRKVILLGVLPYLVIKTEQAKLGLQFLELGHAEVPEQREKMWQKMKLLNQRGRPVETDTQDDKSSMIQSELMGDHESESVETLIS